MPKKVSEETSGRPGIPPSLSALCLTKEASSGQNGRSLGENHHINMIRKVLRHLGNSRIATDWHKIAHESASVRM